MRMTLDEIVNYILPNNVKVVYRSHEDFPVIDRHDPDNMLLTFSAVAKNIYLAAVEIKKQIKLLNQTDTFEILNTVEIVARFPPKIPRWEWYDRSEGMNPINVVDIHNTVKEEFEKQLNAAEYKIYFRGRFI